MKILELVITEILGAHTPIRLNGKVPSSQGNGLVHKHLSTRCVKISTGSIRKVRISENDLSLPIRQTTKIRKTVSFRELGLYNHLEFDVK